MFPALGDLRIPLRYVAGILAAGDPAPVEESLRRLLAMRIVKRSQQLGEAAPAAAASEAGMSLEQVERLFRLLALAPYDERYVIPRARREEAGARQAAHRGGAPESGQTT